MKSYRTMALALAVMLVCAFASRGLTGEYSFDYMPAKNPELDKALGDESLLAVAEKTTDGKTLLGLARFASPETRAKIVEMVEKVSPADAPAAAALVCAFAPETKVRPEDLDEFLKADPTNGVPLCLKARLLPKDGKAAEAIGALRNGLATEKFETYDKPEYRKGIISALDLLGLKGEVRLLALQRVMNDRVNLHSSQAIYFSFYRIAQDLFHATRQLSPEEQIELSDLLVKLGGRLMHENGNRREGIYCAFSTLALANHVRAIAATDKDVQAAYAIIGYFVWEGSRAQDMTQGDLLEALTVAGANPPTLRPYMSQYYDMLPPADKAKVDDALAKVQEAGRTLVDLMAANPDEIAGVAVVSDLKSANSAMLDYPKVREAMQRVLDASEAAGTLLTNLSAPLRSKNNLMKIGLSLLMYSNDHSGQFPPDLKTLVTEGYLQKGSTIEAPITGKPYTYLGASMRDDDFPNTIVAYDDAPIKTEQGTQYIALYVDGHVTLTPVKTVEDAAKPKSK